MSLHQRLTKIERSLSPRDAVLLWVEEARLYLDLEAYARAQLAAGVTLSPIEVLVDRAAATSTSSRAGNEGERPVRTLPAVRDVVFLHALVLTLNESAQLIARDLLLRGLLAGRLMSDVLSDESDTAKILGEAPPTAERGSMTWEQWRELVTGLAGQLRIEEAAWALLGRRYFKGRSVLLPAPAEEWGQARAQLERLEALSKHPPAGVDAVARRRRDGKGRFDASVLRRADELADDAGISAFQWLGESAGARSIISRRLSAPRVG